MDKINRLLLRACVTPANKGFSVMRDALEILEKEPDYLERYAFVALRHEIGQRRGISDMAVERRIRRAIEGSWDLVPLEDRRELFGNIGVTRMPMSKEYLACLSLHLKEG